MNVPIFSGGQRHYQLQQEKLNLLKIQNNFRSLKNSISVEIKQSTVNFDNALKSLTAQKANMELAGKVAKVTKIKYEQGVGSNIEVVDAENSLRQAQTNYYNALYDVMVARVDIEKAFGKILSNTRITQ
jgi:outer membrane protein TolC